MTDLTELLDRASDVPGTPTPVNDDLARAHTALRSRRRRRSLVAAGSVCAVAVLAGTVGPTLVDDAPERNTTTVESEDSLSMLVASTETAGPYTFGKLPRGWEIQGTYPQGVTIAEIGDDDQEPLSFIGKLVIMYDQNPLSGEPTEYNGRVFYTRGDSGHSAVYVQTRDGEPEGVVSVQYPDSAGWDVATMIEFLDAVEVGPGAQPGLG